MIKKILVFGAGYVGGSLSILLAQNYEVVLVDVDSIKVNSLNNNLAPIDEPLMQEYLLKENIRISAHESFLGHLDTSDLVILALPTNYNEDTNYFDTSSLESVLNDLHESSYKGKIVIKSTIPIGFTERMKKMYPCMTIIFVPEFLREGRALLDILKPSRIIVGGLDEQAIEIGKVFLSISENDPKILYVSSTEAEAIKLFSNTYLATRVSFFNELDSFAIENKLSTRNIIDGLALDPRIGSGYNNPSFGYGGYCLPKDTKQLLANYEKIPQGIFRAVVESNKLRKDFLAQKILELNPNSIGIFRLIMKKGSENFRDSAIFDIMEILKMNGINLIVYEPLLPINYLPLQVTHDLISFKKRSDLILANRMDELLSDVSDKTFTRDIYGEN